MFFGYDNEAQMREHNPAIAERLIQLAKPHAMTTATSLKNLTGYSDGVYIYADGSSDKGIPIQKMRAEFKGHIFVWASE